MCLLSKATVGFGFLCVSLLPLAADSDVYLLDVPDYDWYAGCYGTASGNLMGYWDRHGFPDFYTGPTAGGVAPLKDSGTNAGIRSMWATKAGFDGRPANQPGHIDDYWLYYSSDFNFSYQSTAPDPYVTAGRPEHTPDCITDFLGVSQKKWTNMNGECDGNIDAYSFVYWDTNGERRINYTPSPAAGLPPRDIQSGLREWTKYRGYEADVFTQLTDFNPHTPSGTGFSFEDLKAEINAGYPVLVFLQDYNQFYRSFTGMSRGNPEIHGMMVYGYRENPDFGVNYAHCRTSWASGDDIYYAWGPAPWVPGPGVNLSVRGVIGYHPKPKIRSITRKGTEVTMSWDAPSSQLYDSLAMTSNSVHRLQIQRSATVNPSAWVNVGSPTTARTLTFTDCCKSSAFFRVWLLGPDQ
jgi:hypothetical protein